MRTLIRKLTLLWVTFSIFSVLPGTANAGGCGVSISTEGSFFSGRTFRASMVLANSKKSSSFDKILATLAEDGWQIVSSNKDAGFISVNQMINFGRGMTVPLNVTIKNYNQGIKINTSIKTPSGTMVKKPYVQSTFCKVYNAASGGSSVKQAAYIGNTGGNNTEKSFKSAPDSSTKCSVQQVLKLIDAGLSENQIQNVCE